MHLTVVCVSRLDAWPETVCVFPVLLSGRGGVLQHPEGVRLQVCEEGAHFREGKRGTADLFSQGTRQTRLIYQRFLCQPATPGGGQLKISREKRDSCLKTPQTILQQQQQEMLTVF